jgi:Fe-S-cluster containining protein
MKRYRDLVAEADRHFDSAIAGMPQHFECRRGCTLCCFGLFEITRLDLPLLEQGFFRLDSAERERVEREVAAILRKHPVPDDWEAESDEAREGWFEATAGVKCPMLDSTGGCVVYESRPLLCRTFGLPIREGARYIGDECGLNFRKATRAEKLAAAWDLETEEDSDAAEELTIPEAIELIRRLREGEEGAG